MAFHTSSFVLLFLTCLFATCCLAQTVCDPAARGEPRDGPFHLSIDRSWHAVKPYDAFGGWTRLPYCRPDVCASAVAEPAALATCGAGLLALVWRRLRHA
jgi:hypothetical protein